MWRILSKKSRAAAKVRRSFDCWEKGCWEEHGDLSESSFPTSTCLVPISSSSHHLQLFHLFMLIPLIYTLVFYPYQTALISQAAETPLAFLVIQCLIDALFFLDLVIYFCTDPSKSGGGSFKDVFSCRFADWQAWIADLVAFIPNVMAANRGWTAYWWRFCKCTRVLGLKRRVTEAWRDLKCYLNEKNRSTEYMDQIERILEDQHHNYVPHILAINFIYFWYLNACLYLFIPSLNPDGAKSLSATPFLSSLRSSLYHLISIQSVP